MNAFWTKLVMICHVLVLGHPTGPEMLTLVVT
jgi:hypothetical protein